MEQVNVANIERHWTLRVFLAPGRRPLWRRSLVNLPHKYSVVKVVPFLPFVFLVSPEQRPGGARGGRREDCLVRAALHQRDKDAVGRPWHPGGLRSQERVPALRLNQIVRPRSLNWTDWPVAYCVDVVLLRDGEEISCHLVFNLYTFGMTPQVSPKVSRF